MNLRREKQIRFPGNINVSTGQNDINMNAVHFHLKHNHETNFPDNDFTKL